MKIETGRLVLRIPTKDDFEFLKKMWENGEVMKFVGWPSGLKQPDKNIYDWIDNAQTDTQFKLVIEDKKSGRPIGETGYRLDIDYPYAKGKKSAAPDIKLIPEFWGKGIATEALSAVIDYIFKNTDCEIIQVSPNVKNKGAIALYEKLGFKKVGEPRADKLEPKRKKISTEVPVEYQFMELRE